MKRLLPWIMMIVLVVLCAEGAARLTLLALRELRDVRPPDDFALSEQQLEILDAAMAGRSWNRKYDPDLGWTMTPVLAGSVHGVVVQMRKNSFSLPLMGNLT